MFFWDNKFDEYITLQRNHKSFDVEKLTEVINLQLKDLANIDKFLKRKPQRVLDIGCGIGIFDVAVNDYYGPEIGYYLLDKSTTKDEENKVFYGYEKEGAFYNNLSLTREFLEMNKIDSEQIVTVHVKGTNEETRNYIEKHLPQMDIIVSIISCGFHYPIETYLSSVDVLLKDDGILGFHCRNLEDNLPALEGKYDILHPPTGKIKEGSFLICKKRL